MHKICIYEFQIMIFSHDQFCNLMTNHLHFINYVQTVSKLSNNDFEIREIRLDAINLMIL